MKTTLPAWATRKATAADYDLVKDEYRRGRVQITLPSKTVMTVGSVTINEPVSNR